MKTRPILFSAPMVRALLEGHKTQTRRIIKDPVPTQFPDWFAGAKWDPEFGMVVVDSTGTGRGTWSRECPYGQPGDQLWVREAWQSLVEHDHLSPSKIPEGSGIQYQATYDGWVSKGRPSIHMCQWMSRITLEITGLRVERLQAITEEDAKAEGCGAHPVGAARGWFHDLWDEINGPESWDANPWVWVLEFKRIKP